MQISRIGFTYCVVNGIPCKVFEGHSNTAADIYLGEMYEIKEFIILTGPRERERGMVLL